MSLNIKEKLGFSMESDHPESELFEVVTFLFQHQPKDREEFNRLRRLIAGDLGINQPANRFLIQAYQKLVKNGTLPKDKHFLSLMKKANIRNISGIAVVTSLVKPYMCPGKCIYCPTEARMPKSYIATEPAAARALRLDFSPYEQVRMRIKMLEANGHNADKIEYIIKGGTWNAYPLKYQYWFMYESFKAANDLSRDVPIGESREEDWQTIKDLQDVIEAEQIYNESAKHRLIGVTLETRPDAISPKTIWHMRLQGCTRIELGLQSTDDKILALIERGHTVDQFRRAILLLRKAGFKVDLHFMPDLPGTTAKHDVEMYKEIFEDEALRPDMIKIYPCAVLKSADLYAWLQDGRYTPYSSDELFWALNEMQLATPRYCRISRLIRDIPADVIEAGNIVTNLREVLDADLKKRNLRSVDIRAREIGRHAAVLERAEEPVLFVDEYETVGGREYFISAEDPAREAIYGFIRLRIPTSYHPELDSGSPISDASERDISTALRFAQYDTLSTPKDTEQLLTFMPEIEGCAFVRELHVYGNLVKIGDRSELSTQHTGLGKRLMAHAEALVKEDGSFEKLAVISGVGVRGYYEKLGYAKIGTYMIKTL
jgi:elongator complex protein 3